MTTVEQFTPLSLDQYFAPPEGWKAEFGWMVGYSADVAFLNLAAERFTGYTDAQRAHMGRIYLGVMLDPAHPQIAPQDTPGVLHLLFRPQPRPFRMLHAKVALLAFSSPEGGWLLRLVVSTGNWTRGTLESSLDLAWSTDLSSDHDPSHELTRQSRADIRAAWSMVRVVKAGFDDDLCAGGVASVAAPETTAAHDRAKSWLEAVHAPHGVISRFVDNRTASLLSRVVERIPALGVARNYLALGSGFFQGASTEGDVPSVLRKVVDSLVSRGLMTKTARKEVFCNSRACQAVADSLPALSRNFWSVREAGQPAFLPGSRRDLHAKFLFGSNKQQTSNNFSSPWIYLGSGNLTEPGFIRRMSPSAGNLEAGVVFDPGKVVWAASKGIPPSRLITNLLPVQWDTDDLDPSDPVSPGPEMPDADPDVLAGPIGWLSWMPIDAASGMLQAPTDAVLDGVEVLDASGQPCSSDDRGWRWTATQPRQATVRWSEGTTIVPVIDQFGRVCGSELRHLDLDEAWAELSNFPHPPEDEDLVDQDADTPTHDVALPAQRNQPGTYPIRRVMHLVEQIANQQTSISTRDWNMWCSRLEAVLSQAASDENIAAFDSLNLNPLSPLWEAPFRPSFAESDQTLAGIKYEAALTNVEREWGVADLQRLGGPE